MFLLWIFVAIALGVMENITDSIDAFKYQNSDNKIKYIDPYPSRHDAKWYEEHPDYLSPRDYIAYNARRIKK